jgi:hypothetical protein
MTPQNFVTLHREVVEQLAQGISNYGLISILQTALTEQVQPAERTGDCKLCGHCAATGEKVTFVEQVQPCIGKDPLCPCQDGDACHYKDAEDTKALPVKVEQVQPHESYYDKQSLRDVLEQAARIAFNANCPDGDDYAHGYNKAAKYIERAIRAMIGEIK